MHCDLAVMKGEPGFGAKMYPKSLSPVVATVACQILKRVGRREAQAFKESYSQTLIGKLVEFVERVEKTNEDIADFYVIPNVF